MRNRILAFALALALGPMLAGPLAAAEAVATFAGGCFWCMEPPYDKLDGVKSTVSGFMGGDVRNPSYQQVVRGGTGHAEVVQVTYDPEVVSYETLLAVYWRNVDPFDGDGQFCDRGPSYRPEIFWQTEAQREAALESRAELAGRFDNEIAVDITEAGEFWPAEDYHQNYYEKNPVRYKFYRWNCGRDSRLQEVWGDEAAAATQ
ncbi:MAG TPA: peptide-methionine (S)-S-oxide reductase MsrA [Pseudohaliea sp.]|jgi:peptide-methionine (S)-S-oxide reductase|nr:peptide-methionine (S)-S-oxide reductase MsrA [Pseudohaliea sp.]HKL62222.1 peptide-methionine (S)-S-oxide reductase MsrA [Woeseiaceae bacterium]